MNTHVQQNIGGFNIDDIVNAKLEELRLEEEKRKRSKKKGVRKKKTDEDSTPTIDIDTSFPFSVEDLVERGKEFYSADRDGKNQEIGVSVSLRTALKWSLEHDGVVATMPFLIAGLSIADLNNYLRKEWHTTRTEEYSGIDIDGVLGSAGEPVVVTLHGGGILTPGRILKAINEGVTPKGNAVLTSEEFNQVLRGSVLPEKYKPFPFYTVDDVKNDKVSSPFGRYAVWLPLDMAESTQVGPNNKKEFMKNNLVLARAGTPRYIEQYFDNVQAESLLVCNYHRFKEINPKVSQVRMLFINNTNAGLDGGYTLCGASRYVAVGRKKKNARSKTTEIRKRTEDEQYWRRVSKW